MTVGCIAKLTVVLALLPKFAFAIPVSPPIQKILQERGRIDLLERFEAIPVVPPEKIVEALAASGPKLLGAGYNGITFKSKNSKTVKMSFAVFSQRPEIQKHWNGVLDIPAVSQFDFKNHIKVETEEAVDLRCADKELMGSLLWAAYEPNAVLMFPDFVSEDGFAYQRAYAAGTPLDAILQAQRLGPYARTAKAKELASKFDRQKLWQRVIELQNKAERMLLETGTMIDLLNPANFLVTGTHDDPRIEVIDHELILPSRETLEYYAKQGHRIPEFKPTGPQKFVFWPLMPDHIVSSLVWNIGFQQSVDYLQERYGFESRYQAIAKLASLPRWPIEFAPSREDFTNNKIAHAAVCARALQPKRD